MTRYARDRSTDNQTKPALNGYPATIGSAGSSSRSLYEVSLEIKDKVDSFLAEEAESSLLHHVQSQVREAIRVVDEAFRRYQPQEIAISYNGGKDCMWNTLDPLSPLVYDMRADSGFKGLVLLIIILACLARRYSPPNKERRSRTLDEPSDMESISFPQKLQAVYIVSPHPFPEIDDFVVLSSADYQLDVRRYELGMKQGLQEYLADRPNIKAIFVGTRRTDPHGEKLSHFDPTDRGWPDFMRVHPVIDWHYADVWAFIRHLGIPYCPLYDKGYTSLGGTEDTQPNPHLRRQPENGGGFLPAYELVGDEEERLGRDK
ncbi:adenine nucleotide alpha hydrolases-like protein [Xylaria nigripes]|nr:adenine nucleotide alpha hydrolases-like protein [Xylaria nigripes]